MKNLLIALAASSLFFSCNKESIKPVASTKSPENYLQTTPGSFWVYQNVLIDEYGNETIDPVLDTIVVVGDTLINSKSYVKYMGRFMGNAYSECLRDSMGYIVHPNGTVAYSYLNFTDELSQQTNALYNYSGRMENMIDSPSTVPAGEFGTIDMVTTITYVTGDDLNACGDQEYKLKYKYNNKVGRIYSNCLYNTDLTNCRQREQRLVDYYIP